MSISVNSAAHYICEQSNWQATNLSLQKILYLAHMVHIGRHQGQPLVDGEFQAWDYGPVHPALYQKIKAFGSKPIPNVFFALDGLDTNTLEVKTLREACDNLLSKSAGELVRNTHWENGAWARNYVPGRFGIIIPKEHIREEYNDRMGRTD